MKKFNLTALFGILFLTICGSVHAQAPIPGQPYLVPAGYESYGAGTLISYGGFNYVLQGDGTMLLGSQPSFVPDQPVVTYYQPPVYYPTVQYQWTGGGRYHHHYPTTGRGGWGPSHYNGGYRHRR